MYHGGAIFVLVSALLALPVTQQRDFGMDKSESLGKPRKRTARSFPSGLGIDLLLKGLRASSQLLRGTKVRNAIGPVREYEKNSGFYQALKDFNDVGPTDVEILRTSAGVIGKRGKVGDRNIVLTYISDNGFPTVEITKFRNLNMRVKGQHVNVPDQIFTDRIVYTKRYP